MDSLSVIRPSGPVTEASFMSLRAKRSNLIFDQVIVIEIASSTDLAVGTPRNDGLRVFQLSLQGGFGNVMNYPYRNNQSV